MISYFKIILQNTPQTKILKFYRNPTYRLNHEMFLYYLNPHDIIVHERYNNIRFKNTIMTIK